MIYKEEAYQIVGACIEVHREKGCGFLEAVYHECLEIEFEHQGISAVSKPIQELEYRGRKLSQTFQPDFICMGKIVLELKAVVKLLDIHRAQVINYLKATGHKLGLLVNFGADQRLEWERLVYTKPSPPTLLT
jgi:GxxExxY protein